MSGLRLMGIVFGVAVLCSAFLVYRGRRWNRVNFSLLAGFGCTLTAVSLNPNLLNTLRDMLNLEAAERGRLLALLIVSNLLLWLLWLHTRMTHSRQRGQFDHLVRAVSLYKTPDTVLEALSRASIAVVIPALNEAQNLGELLPRIPARCGKESLAVLVVDDGSRDKTPEIARAAGACVVTHPFQRGGGAALRLGYDILRASRVGICVTMDADGQHDPADIPTLLAPILAGKADIVIGSRIRGRAENISRLRLAGVHLFGFVINRLLGTRISDPSSGFRAFHTRILDSIHLQEDQYHASELIISASRAELRLLEVPIRMTNRKYGVSKKGNDWLYGLHFARVILKSWWR